MIEKRHNAEATAPHRSSFSHTRRNLHCAVCIQIYSPPFIRNSISTYYGEYKTYTDSPEKANRSRVSSGVYSVYVENMLCWQHNTLQQRRQSE